MGPLKTNAELSSENAKANILVLVAPDTELNLKPTECKLRTYIQMFKKAESLLEVLRKQTAEDLQKVMGLGKKMAASHVERFKAFERLPPKQAILLFGGKPLGAADFDEKDQKYAQVHTRMVSGLYGVLRPYDDVRGVRDVPMGAKLQTSRGDSLLDFWGDAITKQVAKDLAAVNGNSSGSSILLGCMPEEYWRAVQLDLLPKDVVARRIAFIGDDERDVRDAYGMMARYIIRQGVEDMTSLKSFDKDGWGFESSSDRELVFARRGGNVTKPLSQPKADGSKKSGKESKKSRKEGRQKQSSHSASASGSPQPRQPCRKRKPRGSPSRSHSRSPSSDRQRKKRASRPAESKRARARDRSSSDS